MQIIPPLSLHDMDVSDTFERELMLDSAREQSVGGETWTVVRAGEAVGIVAGWVCRTKPTAVTINGSLFQPDDQWLLVADGTPEIEQHDVLTSALDDSYRFQVMAPERRHSGYTVAVLEETG